MGNKKLGRVEIKPQALAVIVSIAVKEVDGVSKLIGTLTSGTLEKIGKKEYTRGVKLNIEEGKVNVEVNCSLKSGFPVSTVASKIQENVRNSLYNMTELETNTINVNILAIDY